MVLCVPWPDPEPEPGELSALSSATELPRFRLSRGAERCLLCTIDSPSFEGTLWPGGERDVEVEGPGSVFGGNRPA